MLTPEFLASVGTEKQLLSKPGATIGGTVYYQVNGMEEGKWQETLPTAVDAGIYRIYYMAVGDENHNSTTPSEGSSIFVEIEKADTEAPAAPVVTPAPTVQPADKNYDALKVGYQISDKVKVNAAYFQTNYDTYKQDVAPIVTNHSTHNDYTRTNKVVGVGVEIKI